jgi:uncharacterized alpha-E superfamily protein
MLSRVAEAIYWMGRYLERAENTARFLNVNWHLSLDLPSSPQDPWAALVAITGDQGLFDGKYTQATKENVIAFLTFDEAYPNSIRCCLASARENARTVREMIPIEMWEQINTFYHWVIDPSCDVTAVLDNPNALCEQVKERSLMLGGLADAAMDHDEAGLFFHMGRLMERADKTSRILDVKYFILLPDLKRVGSNLDYIQWTALLKATSSLQAYRHHHGRIVPMRVAEFLLLDHHFPRSVLYCLSGVQQCLHDITGTPMGYFTNEAEKRLGQLCSELAYQSVDDIFETGLHEFTDLLQTRMNAIDSAIYQTFFAKVPAIESIGQQQ